jgi:hypothetical protein
VCDGIEEGYPSRQRHEQKRGREIDDDGELHHDKKGPDLKVLSESFHQAAVPDYDAEVENIFNTPKRGSKSMTEAARFPWQPLS